MNRILVPTLLALTTPALAHADTLRGVTITAGFGSTVGEAAALSSRPASGTATASGPAVNFGAYLLGGRSWKMGGRSDVIGVLDQDRHALAATVAAVLRVGDRIFGDIGLGAGYTRAQRSSAAGGKNVVTDTIGPCASLHGGIMVANTVAFVARIDLVYGIPGIFLASGGIDWRL